MKINPENWLFNKDKSILLNIDNGKVIKKNDDFFELYNSIHDRDGYCRIIDNNVKVPMGSEEKYFVDDLIYNKLARIFKNGFDYSDYNLY